MNAIIIDDEINSIKSLRWEIEHFTPDVIVVGTFTSALDAINFLEENNSICVVFLDVEMPKMNGFEFIKHFTERNFNIIFTTAYSKFALEALKIEAIDYLLKPIDSDELTTAIKKVKKRLNLIPKKEKNTKKDTSNIEKIKINHNGKINFINTKDIVYIEADGNYCKIHFEQSKSVLITSKLKDVYKDLPKNIFFRIHKSYVINVSKITSYYRGQQYIELNKTTNLPLARARKKEFIEKFL